MEGVCEATVELADMQVCLLGLSPSAAAPPPPSPNPQPPQSQSLSLDQPPLLWLCNPPHFSSTKHLSQRARARVRKWGGGGGHRHGPGFSYFLVACQEPAWRPLLGGASLEQTPLVCLSISPHHLPQLIRRPAVTGYVHPDSHSHPNQLAIEPINQPTNQPSTHQPANSFTHPPTSHLTNPPPNQPTE